MGHAVERRLGAFLSHYATPVSVWRVGDHRRSVVRSHWCLSSRLCILGSSGSSLAGNERVRGGYEQSLGGVGPSHRILDSFVGTLSRRAM